MIGKKNIDIGKADFIIKNNKNQYFEGKDYFTEEKKKA